MISQLKKMLIEKLCIDKDMATENEELNYRITILNAEQCELKTKVDKLQNSLNIALDEIVCNQKRIDALLRQLDEKNGGSK